MFFISRLNHRFALDQVAAITILVVGAAILAVSYLFRFIGGVHLVITVVLAATVYLVARNRLNMSGLSFIRLGNSTWLLSQTIFFISVSFILYIDWSSRYYRPVFYFIFCLTAVTAIIVSIFSLDEKKNSDIFFVLFSIVLLTLIFYAGIYYEFPGVYGVDSWWHNTWIQETIDHGRISEGDYLHNDYFLFPIFHLSSAVIQIITQVSVKTSIFLSTSVTMAVSCLFVFLIGRRLLDQKAGLLAALILSLSDQVIGRFTAVIAMSMAFCFFLAIIYLVLGRQKISVSGNVLVLVLSLTLILTHTIAALVTLLSLVIIRISIKIYNMRRKQEGTVEALPITVLSFFGLAMIGRWMQPQSAAKPFFDINVSNLVNTLRYQSQFALTGPSTTKNVAYVATVLDEGGFILLLAVGIIGMLLCLRPGNRNGLLFGLVGMTSVLVVLPQIFNIFSLTGLLPARWLPFSYVALSLVGVIGISGLSSLTKYKVLKTSMALVGVLAVISFMIISEPANTDSPIMFNGARRVGYTESELAASRTLADTGAGRPTTDLYYGMTIPYVTGFERYEDMLQEDSRVFIRRNYYIMHPEWNQYYMSEMITGGNDEPGAQRVLVSDFTHIWGIDRWPLIYTNNDVDVYSSAAVVTR